MKKETVTSIYTCLEMLRAANRADLADWWCNLLYTETGDIHYPMWTESYLSIIENDVIHHA